jgi:glycosyltransferase involved in cell wall biosynthesis
VHILLLSASYAPEKSGIAPYSEDLAVFLSNLGNRVHVVSSSQSKETGSENGSVNPFLRVSRLGVKNSSSKSIVVSIIREISMLKKLNNLLFDPTFDKPDVVISVVPSLSYALIGCRYSKKNDIATLVVFQDIISLGAKQIRSRLGKVLSPLIEGFESYVCKYTDSIIAISPEIYRHLTSYKYLSGSSISLIYNYQLQSHAISSDYDFRSANGIGPEVTVVMHTGNMGRKQDLQNVIRAAKELQNFKNILFVFVGEGNQETYLRKISADLSNILFLKFVERNDYNKLLQSADILLVNEIPTQNGMSLPSKLTSYLASGVPILASVPPFGPSAKFLKNMALMVEAGNPKELAQAVLLMSKKSNYFKEMSVRARAFAESELAPSHARNEYLRVIETCYNNHLSKRTK